MSKEEFLKIQTCFLKVHIHCDGCKHKVKKILQKIDGVYKFNIDSEQGKVTVSGNIDAATLIKKLTKHGKHAELWGAPKPNNNQQIANQLKDMKIDGGFKGGNMNNKGQKGGGGGGAGSNQQLKGLGGGGPNNQLPQHLQQQMKVFEDMKLPQLKGLNMPVNSNNNKGGGQDQKPLKFKVPDEDEFDSDDLDDDFDSDEDDYDEDDDEFDDEFDDAPQSKMKPQGMGNSGGGGQLPNVMMTGGQMPNMANIMKSGGQMPNMQNMMKNGGQMPTMPNMMMNGQHPMLMKGGIGGGAGGAGGGIGKNGGGAGGGGIPVQMNMGGGNNNGKKGGDGVNQNQGGGSGGQKGGQNGGGQPQGGGQKQNNGGGNIINSNGVKKGSPMNDEFQGMPSMMAGMNAGGVSGGGPMTNMPMGQMRQMGNGPMGQVPAVQGLPASMGSGNGGNPGGYFPGGGPQAMPGNPYYQQQLSTAMMNQPRAITVGNDRFQPMMYARPPPETNYMPLYHPYGPYPPPPTPHDPYTNYFDDENASSCIVM